MLTGSAGHLSVDGLIHMEHGSYTFHGNLKRKVLIWIDVKVKDIDKVVTFCLVLEVMDSTEFN